MLFSKKRDDDLAHDLAAGPKAAAAKASNKVRMAQTRSVIDPGLLITGILEGDGELQIDGHVRGDVRCTHLTVGSAATVDGNITADEVVVRGKVTGVIGGNRVMLMDSARVDSEIFHKRLSIEEGAHFEGEARFDDQPIEKARSRTQEKIAADGEVAARREEQAVPKANGSSAEIEDAALAARANAEAEPSGLVMASPPAAAPAREAPARNARARSRAAQPDSDTSTPAMTEQTAIGEPDAAPAIKAAGSELRARLRS